MNFCSDFNPIAISQTNSKYYLGEEILKEYKDEFDREYILTKGQNRYYLYKKAIYYNNYSEVACTMDKINKYIFENKLEEYDDNN